MKGFYDLPEEDPLMEAVVNYEVAEDDTYGMIILNGYRCRNCGSVAHINLVRYNSGRVYTLCKDCYTDYIPEDDIDTYGWSYEQLRERDLKLQNDVMKDVRL